MFRRLNAVLRPASPAERDAGLSLVEVIVALLVFAIMTVGAIAAVATSLRLTSDNRGREVAVNLASSEIDLARATAATQLDGRDFTTDPIDGVTYTVRRDVAWSSSAGVDSQCSAGAPGSGSLFYNRVNVTVSWSGMRSSDSAVTADTIVAPDGKVSSSTTGTVLVSVKDNTGAGVKNTTVTITPDSDVRNNTAAALDPDSRPARTDVNGCAFALNVKPGTYTVSLSRTGGDVYVDQDQSTTPTRTVSFASGGSTSATFDYAPADRYELVWPAGALRADDQQTTFLSGSARFVASAPTDVQYLYPLSSGYQVFAGAYAPGAATAATSCLSPDPTKWPRAADGRTGKPVVTSVPDYRVGPVARNVVVPAQATAIPVPAGDRVVRITTATAAGGDPGCRATTTMTFAIPSGATTATLALPPGTWSFKSGRTVSDLRNTPAPVTTVDPRTAP